MSIVKFNTSRQGSVFVNSGLDYPSGITVDSKGNLYVANNENSTIMRFDSTGHGGLYANSRVGVSGPAGLAIDNNDNLYVANFNNDSVLRFDAEGNVSTFASGNYPQGATGIAVQIPEPATALLVIIGLLSLCGAFRQKQQ